MWSHICHPPPSAMQWMHPTEGSQLQGSSAASLCLEPGTESQGPGGAALAPVFTAGSGQILSTLYPSVPAIWEGTGRSCLAQEQPTGDGILPHGRPRTWGIAVPHSVLKLPPLPGCRAIGQGCHPLKKTLLVRRTWLCTLGCRIAPSSEPGHLCTSLQLPWTWPDAPRSGTSQRGSDHDEPHAKARQSSGELC